MKGLNNILHTFILNLPFDIVLNVYQSITVKCYHVLRCTIIKSFMIVLSYGAGPSGQIQNQ